MGRSNVVTVVSRGRRPGVVAPRRRVPKMSQAPPLSPPNPPPPPDGVDPPPPPGCAPTPGRRGGARIPTGPKGGGGRHALVTSTPF
ncbi:Hypothetical protein NTJ_14808 [Nesidiocoris tenuis]|uniref:Uncharacterized protein n=1 Tax=Nesidiocoris tenuis TaxID=355587 RepID=A0ABN7BDQ9_9HEMI|nr:Hypothetical protein NTJ_14808 [Nesidiocoris tenuis]